MTTGLIKRLTLLCALTALAGCAATPMRPPPGDLSDAPPHYKMPQIPKDGSIYHDANSVALFEDLRAKRVGDILTVVLAEKTDAKKEATTSTDKENGMDLGNPTLLGSPLSFNGPGPLSKRNMNLAASVDTSQKFTGQGDSAQSNSLTGNVTVTVVSVMPNGNLVVRGEKIIRINQGDEYLRVSGVVRPVDISTDNSVLSTQLADARISYSGTGFVADSNHMGWLARFFNSPWWPF